ncbi:unnamed protein product [Protopolystoma xenopodis]|uniref:Dynein heavy chain C-terminal domain-containing protein n=1 Tax=Protopolystoma xenopodis TaxID=117903 RepID=A0A3S5FDM6_9PLAT|nr:unnamed protein product [Protopolystoma xenopodis]
MIAYTFALALSVCLHFCYLSEDLYVAPCYYYPNRAGTMEKPSFMIGVDLKTGERPPEHWIKRSTALLMNLDT